MLWSMEILEHWAVHGGMSIIQVYKLVTLLDALHLPSQIIHHGTRAWLPSSINQTFRHHFYWPTNCIEERDFKFIKASYMQ
jgi:hypothetical protein